jgi:hypothetical protein
MILLVLYGCDASSVIVHRVRVFESRVLKGIFRPKRDEMTGGCRKLHNEELHNLYSSPDIIRVISSRRMRWERHATCMGEMIDT